jgi:hypothetical protein
MNVFVEVTVVFQGGRRVTTVAVEDVQVPRTSVGEVIASALVQVDVPVRPQDCQVLWQTTPLALETPLERVLELQRAEPPGAIQPLELTVICPDRQTEAAAPPIEVMHTETTIVLAAPPPPPAAPAPGAPVAAAPPPPPAARPAAAPAAASPPPRADSEVEPTRSEESRSRAFSREAADEDEDSDDEDLDDEDYDDEDEDDSSEFELDLGAEEEEEPATARRAPVRARKKRAATPAKAKAKTRVSVPKMEEAPTPVIQRHATVRYYSRMNPNRIYPLMVALTKKALQQLAQKDVGQVGKKVKMKVGAALEIEPVLPGCECYPPRQKVRVDQSDIKAEFHVVPRMIGEVPAAKVVLYENGEKLTELPLNVRVSNPLFVTMTAGATLLIPFLSATMKHFHVDFESQLQNGFDAYLVAARAALIVLRPEVLAGILLLLTGLVYLMLRPRQRDAFWDITSEGGKPIPTKG